jgi:hypothetical protein
MNPDHDIDRVLSALRDTTLPPAMERRILDALKQRSTTPSFWSTWNLRRLSATGAAFALPAAAAVLLLLTYALAPHHTKPTTARTSSPAVAPTLAADTTIVTPTQILPRIHQGAARPQAHRPHALSHLSAQPAPSAPIAATCHCDPVALAETLAPSKPAPPLPLTAQEVMLLRVVSRGNTVELAQLDPSLRARSTARERAQFQNFFAPSSTGDKE